MKYITVIPTDWSDKATIIIAYNDLVITCVEGEVNSAGNVYGIIYDIDRQAARGGYEGYITDRLQVIGVDNDDLVEVTNVVTRAMKSNRIEHIAL